MKPGVILIYYLIDATINTRLYLYNVYLNSFCKLFK